MVLVHLPRGLKGVLQQIRADLPLRPMAEWHLEEFGPERDEYVAIVTSQCRLLRFGRKALSFTTNHYICAFGLLLVPGRK